MSPLIELGQRFRDVAPGLFGRYRAEWIVEHLQIGTHGAEYARLVGAFDPSVKKTLSVAVLSDRRRFARVSPG